MQKTFIRYTFAILTAAIFLILSLNVIFTLRSLQTQQLGTFHVKIEQVIHTLENNQAELALMNENLDKDYLTRARAAAFMLDKQQVELVEETELRYMAELLDVDELHVIDGNGMIVSASVERYIGMNMAEHEQTRAFLALLESDDEDAYLIQEARPNAAEGRVMQYVGVARKGRKGIVQVGFEPKRQQEVQARNTYEYIFSKFPTDLGEELFVLDIVTGTVLGHSGGLDREFTEEYYHPEKLEDCAEGGYKQGTDGKWMYVVSREYESVLICAAIPGEILFWRLIKNVLHVFVYLIAIEAMVLLLLSYLVKRKVIDGIHSIIESLSAITDGNLDREVTVGGNREFEELSRGINAMVKSIISISGRISAIIEISGVPLAAFEYENSARPVFVTSGLKELLGIPDSEATELYRKGARFDRYIRALISRPTEGEEDIYPIGDSRYVQIHMSRDGGRNLGVITDVTRDMMEKKQMQYENTHDSLTGLYKYRFFKQLAGEILKKNSPGKLCAIVMLDLDYFKSVNDTFGHAVGDSYLQSFALIMKAMPLEHFIMARRSGDEFCMLISDCDSRERIIEYMDMFYKALERNPIALSETIEKTISVSGGFAWTDEPDSEIDELLSRADEALYDVKRTARGRYTEYRGSSGKDERSDP